MTAPFVRTLPKPPGTIYWRHGQFVIAGQEPPETVRSSGPIVEPKLPWWWRILGVR